jgi:hypothetical protein
VLGACSNKSSLWGDIDPNPARGVSIDILWPPGEIPAMSQSYFVIVGAGNTDNVPTNSLVNLVEIDPGDGSGWHDITAYYFAHMTGPGNWIDNGAWPYTFASPGKYFVYARARYYDGEVVTSEVMVTTIPAPAST